MAPPGEVRLETSVYLMDAVLREVEEGRWRVPRFQRPYVWTPERMLDLFDSIERGYPIGSLLLWQTDEQLETVEQIGNIAVPSGPRSGRVAYVLDGHQRVSTLYGVLRRPEADAEDWRWNIYRDLRRRPGDDPRSDLFVHYRREKPPNDYLLPLRAVPRTMDFLRFARGLESRTLGPGLIDDWLREAESVAQTIKNYQIAVVTLAGGTLDQAVEVYTRLNRAGVRIEADQMVSALTYRDTDRPSLAQRVDDIVAAVAATGFGEVPRIAIFRAVLAISGEEDIMSPRWESLALRLEVRLVNAVPDTERAVLSAVAFLRRIGLPLAQLLPYAHQLTLISYFWHLCPTPTVEQEEQLRRWFWITSWTGAFAGANSSTVRNAIAVLQQIGQSASELALATSEVLPTPDKFNFNSARTRAYVAWELGQYPKRLDEAGHEFDPVKLLAAAGSQVFRWVIGQDQRPANKVMMPSVTGRHPWDQICEPVTPRAKEFLLSHGITRRAQDRLREGDGEGFVTERAAELDRQLGSFLRELGVRPARGRRGDSREDTE